MSATALDVLPLDEAKRQLDLVGTTSRDAIVTDAIERAVSEVGRLNGVPLAQVERTYLLCVDGDDSAAMIDYPIGWPQPVRSVSVQWRTDAGATGSADAVTAQREDFGYDPAADSYSVSPAAFGLTEWPAQVLAWTGVVGLAGRPEPRVIGACVIAMRAIYRDEWDEETERTVAGFLQ